MKTDKKLTKAAPARSRPSARAGSKKPRRPDVRGSVPRRIVVPVDFSAGSLRALDLADSLADRFNAVVSLVHVLDPIYTPGRFDSPRLRPLRAEARHEAELKLANLSKELSERSGHAMKHRVVDGTVPEAILAFARSTKADWIVMGSKGQTGMKRLLAGSVAERVVRQAACPVLVVP